MMESEAQVLPSPGDFDAFVPVLVAGGGACGLTAALAASAGGAEVAVLEREPRCEGSSAMSLGATCAAGTAEQAAHGVEDDADCFEADIIAKTAGRVDRTLAAIAARQSGPALDWLGTLGIPFQLDTDWRPAFGHTRQRMHGTPGGSGEDMMARFVTTCEDHGVPILTSARVAAVYAGESGRVEGVLIERPDGAEERIGCSALILATSGFGGNPAMVGQHIPDMARARYFGWEGNRGDGILLGAELGGATGDMSAYQGLGLLAEPHGIDVNPKLLISGGVQVNMLGERFNDETLDVSGQGARVLAQPGEVAWLLYDDGIHAGNAHLPALRRLLDLDAERRGNGVAEIAAMTGIPADALTRTLAEVEAARMNGTPDSLGRRFSGQPLGPDFRAIRITGALFHTQGGLLVDEDGRVRRLGNGVLPNLYAGGGSACSIGGPGGSGYLPGAGLCMAITLGWVAGRAAAAQIAG